MFTKNDDSHVRLPHDERGAIMVMGIFMCTCLVGALWYLASIGDSILYRERLQEASDAVVFSNVVLHARGMNLIVLINLIMACVLGVRVALKVAQLVCAIAGAVFFVIGIFAPPFMSAAEPCLDAAIELQTVIDDTRPTINDTLKALSGTQTLIAKATPGAALIGATISVGGKYKPLVPGALVLDEEVVEGLPVARGGETKLCKEAGRSLGGITGWLLKEIGLDAFGAASEWLGDKMGTIANLAPGYFCEMGSVGGSPEAAIDAMLGDSAQKRCENGGPAVAYEQAESEWQSACTDAGVTCEGDSGNDRPVESRQISEVGRQTGSTTPEKQRELDELRTRRDAAAKSVNGYLDAFRSRPFVDESMCETWAKTVAKAEFEETRAKNKSSGETDTTDMTGKQVKEGWYNGGPEAQFVGGAIGKASFLERSVKFVRIAAVDNARMSDTKAPIEAQIPAWTQAELFFDCEESWSKCNDEEDAMWHLKWRARLRRYDGSKPLDEIASLFALGVTVKDAATGMKAVAADPGTSAPLNALVGNTRLRGELAGVIGDTHVMTHGIH